MKKLVWSLGLLIALPVLVLSGMIVFGTANPPATFQPVSDSAKAMDTSGLPEVSRYPTRNGGSLAYRAYPGGAEKIVILVHGSASSGRTMHGVGKALQANSITAFAPDMRGHGDSGAHGDIEYYGQLEDDLADFVAFVRQNNPKAPITLIGFSSGGGFVLRIAGSSMANLFSDFILLAPYLGYDAPTVRPDSGGWAVAFRPRIIALTLLNSIGINQFNHLPVVAFAVPRELAGFLTPGYSFRLAGNFGPPRDFMAAFAASPQPIKLIAGLNDEIMYADRYAATLAPFKDRVTVQLLPDISHMGIVSAPEALAAMVAAVQKPQN